MVIAILLKTYRSIINKLVEDYMLVNHEYVSFGEYFKNAGLTEDEIALVEEITAPNEEETGEAENAD